MSWATMIVGHLRLKKENERLIKELEDVLECRIRWDNKFKEYYFEDINTIKNGSTAIS